MRAQPTAEWYRSGRRAGSTKFEDRRGIIACGARACFERKGVAKTSIADITREVDITRELFYYYFPNKDAVVATVLDSYVEDARIELTRAVAVAQGHGLELLPQIVRAFRLWLKTDTDQLVPMFGVLYETDANADVLYRVAGVAVAVMEDAAIASGRQDRASEETVLLGRKMGFVGVLCALMHTDALSDEEIAASIAPLFSTGF